MQVVLSKNQIGFDRPSKKELMSLEALLPEGDTSPEDVRRILQYHAGSSIIVIDEIDRIREKDTTQLLADTVKTLSDHSVDCTLVMVGVATSVDDLISEHQSIERALNQIQLPRMSRDELEEIIQNALEELEMTIDNDAQDRITSFSQGLPHYTHLLGQEACLSAIEQKSSSVEMRDVDVATEQAIEKTQRTIKKTFHDAVSSSHEDTLFIPVLVACALATGDELGRFAASDVREPLSNITGTDYKIPTFTRHLHSFSEDRGPVLVRQGSKHRHRFRFRNPLMLPYAIMYGYTENIIDEKIIEQYYNK
jgi:Cdc6-like AAA superfamily ATPase